MNQVETFRTIKHLRITVVGEYIHIEGLPHFLGGIIGMVYNPSYTENVKKDDTLFYQELTFWSVYQNHISTVL